MLHSLDSMNGCGNREPPFLRDSSRISSGDFGSLIGQNSFTNSLEWNPYTDVIPDYPSDDEMTSQVKRLQTFRNWPSSCPVKPKELAEAGFYYAGVGDNVRCFRCDLTLRKWEAGDNPWEDHKKCKPLCPFVSENTLANPHDVACTVVEASSSNVQSSSNAIQTLQSSRDVNFGSVTSEKDRERPVNLQQNPRNQFSFQNTEERRIGEQSFSYEGSSRDRLQAAFLSGVRDPGFYGFQQQMYSTPRQNQEMPSHTRQTDMFIPGQTSGTLNSLQGKEGIKAVVSQSPSSLPPEQMKPTEQGRMTRPIHSGGMVFQLNPESQISIISGGQGASWVTSCNTSQELQPLYLQGQANQLEVQGLHAGQSSMHPAEVHSFVHSASQVKTGKPCYPVQSGMMGRETKPSRYHEPGSHIPHIGRERPRQMANVAYPVVDPTLEEGQRPLTRQEDARHVVTSADLASEHQRLTTFVDWPQDSPVRPWELSVAGFYFIGTGDSVKCYKCGVSLTNWEPDDTPWREHKKWSPQCPLVLQHFHGRTQMGPVEIPSGVPQGHQPYSQFQPTLPHLPQSLIRRRSQPVRSVVPGCSNEPRMPPTISSGRAMNFSTAEALNYPSLATNNYSGPGSLPGEEVRRSDVPLSGAPTTMPLSTPVHAPGISSSDVEHVVNMGFEREQVNQVIYRRITSTENNFRSLDELLQAVLSSQTRTVVTTPQDSTAHEPLLSRFPIQSTLPALPLENEEVPPSGPASSPSSPSHPIMGLRRTVSAPVDSLCGSSQAENDENLQQKLDRMQEERTCKICMDAEVGVVFLPCGHLSCCPMCASGMDLCPMCRSPIQEKIRTYLS